MRTMASLCEIEHNLRRAIQVKSLHRRLVATLIYHSIGVTYIYQHKTCTARMFCPYSCRSGSWSELFSWRAKNGTTLLPIAAPLR